MTARTNLRAFLIAAVGAAVITLPGTFAGPAPQVIKAQPVADAAEEAPLVAEGPEADLALIYTGGVAGYVDPCG